jgi:NAD(P)-dependent dehydrogenase (short-subunit alcohol dehydrogenase family)
VPDRALDGRAKCASPAKVLVIGCDVDSDGLATTLKSIEDAGHHAQMVTADVTVPADIDRIVTQLPDGRVDVLANIAGIMDYFLPVSELDDATWDRVIRVNLTGVMRLCRAVRPAMKDAGQGVIVTSRPPRRAFSGPASAWRSPSPRPSGWRSPTRSPPWFRG